MSETPNNERKKRINCKGVFQFLPKRIVVATMIFISSSVYFMIYVSFNLLLRSMIKMNNSMLSSEVYEINVGKRYSWTKLQLIQALDVFQVGEAISSVPTGILVEKKGSKRINSLGIALAGAISFVIPFAARAGFSVMCISRLLQGFCCSQVFLGGHFLISRWSPRQEQCKFVWFFQGSMLGATYTEALTIAILDRFRDYHIMFYVTGSLAIAWSVIWYLMISDDPRKHPRITDKELKYILTTVDPVLESKFHFISFREVISSERFWGLIALHLSHEFGFFTVFTLIPKYFEEMFQEMSPWQIFFPNICRLVFALFCAIIMDLLTKCKYKHFGRTEHVKSFVIFSHFMPGLLLCLIHAVSLEMEEAYAMYVACATFMGASTVTNLNLFHDLAPNHSSQLAGYSRLIGLILAVSLRHISAKIRAEKDASEAWSYIFYMAAVMYILCLVIYMFIGSSKLQKWNFHPTSYKYYIFVALSSIKDEKLDKIK